MPSSCLTDQSINQSIYSRSFELHDRLVPDHVNVDLEVHVGEVLRLAEAQTSGDVSLKIEKISKIWRFQLA